MALRADRASALAVVVAATVVVLSCEAAGTAQHEPQAPGVIANLLRVRETALAQARVWRAPATPIGTADLRNDPPGPFQALDEIECRYQLKITTGITTTDAG